MLVQTSSFCDGWCRLKLALELAILLHYVWVPLPNHPPFVWSFFYSRFDLTVNETNQTVKLLCLLQYQELLLASYNTNPELPHEPDGVCLVWNSMFKKDSPEYIFHCQVFISCIRRLSYWPVAHPTQLSYLCMLQHWWLFCFDVGVFCHTVSEWHWLECDSDSKRHYILIVWYEHPCICMTLNFMHRSLVMKQKCELKHLEAFH